MAVKAESILLEMDVRNAELNAKLAQSTKAVDAFKSRTQDTLNAGKNLGDRYGAAAVQIASATEQMARSGQVAGDALKQVVQQGASVAFMFGPQGAIAGAIGITAIAVVGLFERSRREMEETARKAAEELRSLRRQSLVANSDAATELFQTVGAPMRRRAELQARIRQLAGPTTVSGAGEEELTAIRERNRLNVEYSRELDEIEKKFGAQIKQYETLRKIINEQAAAEGRRAQNLSDIARREEERAKASKTAAQAEKAAATDAVRQQELVIDRAGEMADRLRQQAVAAQQFGDEMAAALRRLTPDTLDDLLFSLQELERQATAARQADPLGFDEAAYQRLRQATLDQIDAVRQMRAVAPHLKAVDELFEQMSRRRSANAADGITFAPTPAEMGALRTYRTELARIADDQTRTQAVRDAAAAALLQVEGAIAGQVEQTVSGTAKIAKGIESAANTGALLVSAFRGANSELAQMLAGVGRVAGGIGDLIEAADQVGADGQPIGFSGLFSTVSGLKTALPILGQIVGALGAFGGLLGESPEEQERRRLQQANTQALEDLTRAVGTLDVTATGSNRNATLGVVAAVQAEWDEFFDWLDQQIEAGADPDRLPLAPSVDLAAILAQQGLTFEEFRRRAQEDFGIELPESMGDVTANQLRDIAAAANTLGFQFERLQERIDVLDLAPTQQVVETLDLLAAKGDEATRALVGVVRGFDLSTEAGRTAAEQAVRDAFESGAISADLARHLLELIADVTLEFEQVADAAKRAADEAARLVDVSEDMEVRRLRAEGDERAAAIREREIAQEREFAEAIEAGFTPEMLAELAEIQALEFQDFLDSLEEDVAGAVERGTTASRGARESVEATTRLTEQTGLLIVELLTTANVYARQTAQGITGLLALLATGRVSPITPPALPAAFLRTGGASGGIVFGNVTIQVIAAPGASPQQVGEQAGVAFMRTVDQYLGGRVQNERANAGIVELV